MAGGGAPLTDVCAGLQNRVALPLHPEYRTLPMVWYVPPLSPLSPLRRGVGGRERTDDEVFGAIDESRIPVHNSFALLPVGCGHRSHGCG
jgi:nitrate reductase beta subunit